MIRSADNVQMWTDTTRGEPRMDTCRPAPAHSGQACSESRTYLPAYPRDVSSPDPMRIAKLPRASGHFPFTNRDVISSLTVAVGRNGRAHFTVLRSVSRFNSKLDQLRRQALADLSPCHLSKAFRNGWFSMTNHSERQVSDVQKVIASGARSV